MANVSLAEKNCLHFHYIYLLVDLLPSKQKFGTKVMEMRTEMMPMRNVKKDESTKTHHLLKGKPFFTAHFS